MTEIPREELEQVFGAAAADEVEQLRPRALASTVGVWRVRCGDRSAVLKLIRLGAAPTPRWPSERDPADAYYWRREELAYRARVAGALAPELLAAVERPDGSVALWLEDLGALPAWTAATLGAAAERIGRIQASPPPDEPFLARGWLRRYLETHGVEPDERLALVDAAPRALVHHDLHPANLFLRDGALAVVDWAYCGVGAVGEDAGVLVADALFDGFVDAAGGLELARAVWHGYERGLRAGGAGDHAVACARDVFVHGTALRYEWIPSAGRAEWREPLELLRRLPSAL